MFLYSKCRKFESIVPRNETAPPHSKFLHSCICERFMYMYIPTIAPQTQYNKIGGLIAGIYKSLTDAGMQKLGIRLHNFISGNICFEFSEQCTVTPKTSLSPRTNIRSAILLAKLGCGSYS